MGSFNTTCFVSQQTIVPGADCYIIPIVQQSTYEPVELVYKGKEFAKYGICSSTCYATGFWGYSGPIIKGKYEDCGKFELENTVDNIKNVISFFNHLYEKLCVVKPGENEYHELPLNFTELYNPKKEYQFEKLIDIWDKLWDVGQESRLFINDYKNDPRQLQFSVMHKKTAEYLFKMINDGKDWNGNSYQSKEFFSNYIINQNKRMISVFPNKSAKDLFDFMGTKIYSLDGFRHGEGEGCNISLFYNNFDAVYDVLEDFLKENPDEKELSRDTIEKLYEISETQIEQRYIHTALNSLNVKLSPMVYASQDYDNSIGNSYMKMIEKINTDITEDIRMDNDWDEDDDFEVPISKDIESEYVLVNFSFKGNDDYDFDTTIVKKVSSLELWEKQIKEKLTQEFEEQNGIIEIYHSDNDSTPREDIDEVLSEITLTKIDKVEYDTILKFFGEHSGPHVNFLEYEEPKPKKKNKP